METWLALLETAKFIKKFLGLTAEYADIGQHLSEKKSHQSSVDFQESRPKTYRGSEKADNNVIINKI